MSLAVMDRLRQHITAVPPRLRMSMKFDALLEKHRNILGVSWSSSIHEDMETVSFNCFNRIGCSCFDGTGGPEETKGNGAAALAEFCDLADSLQLNVYLFTSYKELVPYYEGFGFNQTMHSRQGHWTFIRPYSK